jgi:hypothetical protein
MDTFTETPLRWLSGACLVIGPALFAAATFFWLPNGNYGVTAGALTVLALMF